MLYASDYDLMLQDYWVDELQGYLIDDRLVGNDLYKVLSDYMLSGDLYLVGVCKLEFVTYKDQLTEFIKGEYGYLYKRYCDIAEKGLSVMGTAVYNRMTRIPKKHVIFDKRQGVYYIEADFCNLSREKLGVINNMLIGNYYDCKTGIVRLVDNNRLMLYEAYKAVQEVF